MICLSCVLSVFIFSTSFNQIAYGAGERCFENGKQFHPEDCEDIFPTDACTNQFPVVTPNSDVDKEPARDTACTEDIWAEDALKCAKTCRLCCERPKYDCLDKENFTFCDTNKHKCVTLKDVMVDMCPHTCGLCDLTGVPRCKDNNKICPDLKDSCNDANPITKAATRQLCPETCGDCSGTGATTDPVPRTADCKDVATNCDTQKDLCENTFYKALMKTDCQLSCGWCIPTNYVCKDMNSADCAKWDADGFCNNTAYSRKMRLDQCGKYCKMCT